MRAAAILTLATLLVPVVAQCQDTHEGSKKASVIDNEVWLDSVTGPRQLTQDAVPKHFALLAPDGKRIAYLEEEFSSHVQQNQLPQVIMVDDNGRELWRVTPDGCWPGDLFDMLEWIDDQRIGTWHCGHANCIYWVLDAGSGKTLDVMKGGFDFVWSHNRKWVTRRIVDCCDTEELPGDVVGNPVDEAVMLNKKDVYPPLVPRQQAHQIGHRQRHYLGPFTWSPNDVWLGFTDTISPEGDPYVVLVSPAGAILRETLPVDLQYDDKLRDFPKVDWDDDDHLHLSTGGRLFRFVVDGSGLHEIADSEMK